MKMTEEEAIAHLRTFNAWRCGDESQEAPTPSTVTEAIRTVCDALEGVALERNALLEMNGAQAQTITEQREKLDSQHDLLGKANALARIRIDRIAELEGARLAVPEDVAKRREMRILLAEAKILLRKAEPFTLCSSGPLNGQIYAFLNKVDAAILAASQQAAKGEG